MRRRIHPIKSIICWVGYSFVLATVLPSVRGQENARADLETQFTRTVRPFFETYCISCHGKQRPAAQMDLSGFTTMAALMQDGRRWSQMLERLKAEEMPPKGARQPVGAGAARAVDWFRAVREYETRRNAGDPGVVLARRLSNAEYDYTIRDLTGVDIRPAREFPVDPANTAGFDNSGETLTMSPTLLKKYLAAAREVASHMYLKEKGFALRAASDAGRNRPRQVRRASDHRFLSPAEHRLRRLFSNRLALPASGGARPAQCHTCRSRYAIPRQRQVSGDRLVDPGESRTGRPAGEAASDVASLASAQQQDQPNIARAGCEEMRSYIATVRKKVEPRFINITAGPIGTAWQPLLIWKNTQYATHRRKFDPRQLQVEGEPPFNQSRRGRARMG